jgi:protein CpxP
MRRQYLWSLVLMLAPLASTVAQDSAGPRRADSLRHQIEERFASRVQEQLGLTNEQTAKLRSTSQKFGVRRRELQTRERRVREALSGQLQPGVAANQDSVAKLTDAMIELKLASVQNSRDEMRELSKYLTPVQRARLFVMRERFDRHVKEAHGHRGMGRHRHRDRSWM